ncbi:MAG: hypothetical protein HRT45_09480 [Bdellovibrionales bacterium]|nr:hypothetical protein [Bdellovibrionales bacterium]
MKAFVMFSLCLSFSAFAQGKAKSAKTVSDEEHRKGSGEYVYIHKKRINKKKVRDKFPHAQVVTTADRVHSKRQGVLSLRLQKEFLARTGLSPHIKAYDALAKDLLVIRIQSQPIKRLKKMYKKLPGAALANAKRSLPRYLAKDAKTPL